MVSSISSSHLIILVEFSLAKNPYSAWKSIETSSASTRAGWMVAL